MRTSWLLLFAVTACGDDALPSSPTLTLSLATSIPPGVEAEYCKFVELPDAWVTADHVELPGGSHHVLVYQTPYLTIPTQRDDGVPVDTSGVFDCSDGATNGWSVTRVIGGSQNSTGESILAFPEGVGVHVGGVALLNVHVLNGSDEVLEPDVKVTFETRPEAEIEVEGDVLFLYNPFISVPPGSTATARWRCPVYRDITIANAQSHMHARGIGYEARVDDQEPFYRNTQWEGVPVERYDALVIPAGATIDYRCDYRNTDGQAVYQGPRTTDEMCMLIGSYYPADERTANCLDATGELPGGDWVGNGTASCAATLECIQGTQDLLGVTDCVLASDPAVAHVASEALRCLIASGDGAGCDEPLAACATR